MSPDPETLRLAVHAGIAVEVVPLASWGSGHRGGLVLSTLPPEPAGGGSRRLGHAQATAGTLMDVVYADWPTPLARAAAAVAWTWCPGSTCSSTRPPSSSALFTGEQTPGPGDVCRRETGPRPMIDLATGSGDPAWVVIVLAAARCGSRSAGRRVTGCAREPAATGSSPTRPGTRPGTGGGPRSALALALGAGGLADR